MQPHESSAPRDLTLNNTLLAIAQKHLTRIVNFNPYRNFPAINSRKEFSDLLASDPAFCHLGLTDERYLIARVGGNLITSLHRKIGDMYEEMFQHLLRARFDLPEADLSFGVYVRIGDRKQLRSTDGIVKMKHLKSRGVDPSTLVTKPEIDWKRTQGLGFEVRSCYQIGDSKRIQADYDMAIALESQGFVPVMLILCATSLSPVCSSFQAN